MYYHYYMQYLARAAGQFRQVRNSGSTLMEDTASLRRILSDWEHVQKSTVG